MRASGRYEPMTSNTVTDADFEALEGELRLAQLNADVATLDRLISDDLLFTGPDGALATKADDLAAYRSGAIRFSAHAAEELRVRQVSDDVAVVALRARLAGTAAGVPFAGTFRYTRVWARTNGRRWQIVGGHVSAVDSPAAPSA
jgi:ketosteroid isomerase-like protein